MEINKIYNEDCFVTMQNMLSNGIKPNIILTSPFYNTNKKAGHKAVLNEKNKNYIRYDMHVDNYTEDEYRKFMINLFCKYDLILEKNGVILFNLSYGTQNTTSIWLIIADIIEKTNFTIADCIIWKKKRGAAPNNMSCNKLTRILEYVFVICRKEEFYTFQCNKKVVNERKSGQKIYENISNFIEANNNDGPCEVNKACFSSELCEKLLKIYSNDKNNLIYDSFIGSGTTAAACLKMGLKYIGSEISEKQCVFAEERLKGMVEDGEL